MSIPAFAWALDRGVELDLTPSERLVLIYLADQANGKKFCFCGQPRIVKYTGLAMRTVRAVIHRLAKLQLIRVDAKPGCATHYHILRPDTPANGGGVDDHTPANEHGDTPANGAGAPRQDVPDHPGKSCAEPRHITTGTPANGSPDPYCTQEETLSARAPAREGKVLNSGKEATAPPPAPPPAPQPAGTTDGFNDWLDSGAPASSHCATDTEEITEDDPPQTEADRQRMLARFATLVHELGQSKRSFAILPGPPFTVNEYRDIAESYAPAPRWKTPSPEQLAAMYRASGLRRGARLPAV